MGEDIYRLNTNENKTVATNTVIYAVTTLRL